MIRTDSRRTRIRRTALLHVFSSYSFSLMAAANKMPPPHPSPIVFCESSPIPTVYPALFLKDVCSVRRHAQQDARLIVQSSALADRRQTGRGR